MNSLDTVDKYDSYKSNINIYEYILTVLCRFLLVGRRKKEYKEEFVKM